MRKTLSRLLAFFFMLAGLGLLVHLTYLEVYVVPRNVAVTNVVAPGDVLLVFRREPLQREAWVKCAGSTGHDDQVATIAFLPGDLMAGDGSREGPRGVEPREVMLRPVPSAREVKDAQPAMAARAHGPALGGSAQGGAGSKANTARASAMQSAVPSTTLRRADQTTCAPVAGRLWPRPAWGQGWSTPSAQ
jgi:hypothetical protein